jgi:hypothetical protein
MTAQWKVDRVYSKSGMSSREVFTSPEGVEYVRSSREAAELTVPMKSRGLQPLYLRSRSRPFGAVTKQQAESAVQEGDAKITADIHLHWKE